MRSNNNGNESKIILDMQTGTFYIGVKEAAETIGINYSTLTNYLNGRRKNKTYLEYV